MKNNQTTPEQAERLIDSLKDDTLSFGCWVISNNGTKGVIVGEKKNRGNKRWLCAVPDSHALFYINGGSEVIGHDILKSRIEEKIIMEQATINGWNANIQRLHELWFKCGITLSLQEIAKHNSVDRNNLFDFLDTL